MNKKLKIENIVQAENRGTLLLTEKTKDNKLICQVAVSFVDPKEVKGFEIGREHNISITDVKK
jgi:hypothetical protein